MKQSPLSELGRRTNDPPISWLMKMALQRPRLISLAAGFTDGWSLPVEATRSLVNEILSSPKSARAALQYGATTGDPLLRRLTAERLRAQDGDSPERTGCACSPERILITHGSQQLLYLVTESLCDPGDIVLLEAPTYFVFLGIAQSRGLNCRSVRLESDGLDIGHLERVLDDLKRNGRLPRLKMLYLVTYFQNPSGITTSFEKKAAALQLLRRYEKDAGHPIVLLEDAAYRELRFGRSDVASALAAEGSQERVVYAGTYSKPFATGLRVGYGCLPEWLFKVVVRLKGNHDFGTSNVPQQVVARALASGVYDEQVARLRRRYRKKSRVMTSALQTQFPAEVQWTAPDGGLYVWAQLPRSRQTGPKSELFQRALKRDVLYVPGELCYADDPQCRASRSEMRLSFGNASERDIREGIRRLGKVIARFGKPETV